MKMLLFLSAPFWFWSVKICYLKLSIQAQTLKAIIQNYFKKIAFKIWNSLQKIYGIFLKMCYEIKLFQVYSLQSVSILCIRKWCIQIKTLKSCFNTFHPVHSFFLICKFTIFLLIKFPFYILWIKVVEFFPWQCIVLCLTSNQGRSNKRKLCLMFNRKLTSKNKQAKSNFYLESKLNKFLF